MCVKTLSAVQYGQTATGKARIKIISGADRKDASSFKHIETAHGVKFLQLPCGQCIECRLSRSRVWASRMMHEASLHDNNCFITLTFNDENLDEFGSLRLESFQKFMKRLRRAISPLRVRFFHAGEYGDKFGRPHHHAILFGYDFPDKVCVRVKDGFRYYNSSLLSSLWSHPITHESYGFSEISDVSWESCAYVARYVVKKVNGAGINRDGVNISAADHYAVFDEQGNVHQRKPEFCTMSRNPGIGTKWYEKYKDTDVWAHDRIHIRNGKYQKPPRFYDSKLSLDNAEKYSMIKSQRIELAKERTDNTPAMQASRETIKLAQVSMLKRNIEQ